MQGASWHLCELEIGAVSLLAELERVHIVAFEGGPVAQAARDCPVEHCPQFPVRILHHAACQPWLLSMKPALQFASFPLHSDTPMRGSPLPK